MFNLFELAGTPLSKDPELINYGFVYEENKLKNEGEKFEDDIH